ncbi:MAG: hypothetical protein AB7O38_10465 [Pirellulaceae bacterium]
MMLRWLSVTIVFACGCVTPLAEYLALNRDGAGRASVAADANPEAAPSGTKSSAAGGPSEQVAADGSGRVADTQTLPKVVRLDRSGVTGRAAGTTALAGGLAVADRQVEDALLDAFAHLSPAQRAELGAQLLGQSPAAPRRSAPDRPEDVKLSRAGPLPAPSNTTTAGHLVGESAWLPGPQLPTEMRTPRERIRLTPGPRATSYRASVSSDDRTTEPAPAVRTSAPDATRGVVQPAAYSEPAAAAVTASSSPVGSTTGSWRDQLNATIEALTVQLGDQPETAPEYRQLAANLRLLQVLANRPDQAVAAIEGLPEDEREFWKHQAHALLLALDADGKNAAAQRYALALRELRSAEGHLANLSTLDVRNLALCESVDSYGMFTEFRTQSFRPGTDVLLYVEVDNFTVERVGDRFETELQGVYEIADAQGNRVTNVRLPLDKPQCNNRRRDYFIRYLITLPSDLGAGKYTLHLTMVDVKGQKSSDASLDFRIR